MRWRHPTRESETDSKTPRVIFLVRRAILFLGAIAMSSGLVWAAEWKWINRLSLAERYDDNITQLSPKDLDRLQRQGGGTGLTCGATTLTGVVTVTCERAGSSR